MDVLRALEPKYQDMTEGEGSHRYGFAKHFMQSMLEDYHLFANPLDDICRKAGEQSVKKFMYTPTEGEFVSEDASLDIAIHQLIMALKNLADIQPTHIADSQSRGGKDL
jgi:hypothetical protein